MKGDGDDDVTCPLKLAPDRLRQKTAEEVSAPQVGPVFEPVHEVAQKTLEGPQGKEPVTPESAPASVAEVEGPLGRSPPAPGTGREGLQGQGGPA